MKTKFPILNPAAQNLLIRKSIGILTAIFIFINIALNAQTAKKPVMAVLGVEVSGVDIQPNTASMLLRMEMEKSEKFSVTDQYDVEAMLKQANIDPASCLGRTCMVKAGQALKTDKIVTGSLIHFSDRIILTVRMVDVASEQIEKTQVDEYLALQENVREMLMLSVKRLLNLEYDEELYRKMTLKHDYASEINNPAVERLRLSGPRMGVSMLTGNAAKIWKAPENQGGFNGQPYMYVFGWQLETAYLNSGRVQCLFESVPALTGLDQGRFIPGFTFLTAFRDNITGWEFGFGPNFTLIREATFYKAVDAEGHETEFGDFQYFDRSDYTTVTNTGTRLDSRGNVTLNPAFIVAVGKSFKSGKVNIPVNAYFVPAKTGMRFGLVMGFNGKRIKKECDEKPRRNNKTYND